MYTNVREFGGDFIDVIEDEIDRSNSVTIATGYTSIDIIQKFNEPFIQKVIDGGRVRLLLGMAFYEGLSQTKLSTLRTLDTNITRSENGSGVFVSWSRRFHGKIYHFEHEDSHSYYVGSSNFSSSGTYGNKECTVNIIREEVQTQISRYLEHLFEDRHAKSINQVDIIVPGTRSDIQRLSLQDLDSLDTYDPTTIDTTDLPSFEFDLNRIVEHEKSSLNVYFGRGRWERRTGRVIPRPWFEIELIANREINTNPLYPRGNFTAFTDDGFIMPMRTQGDYNKNIRSRDQLTIFGMWLKGKLQQAGALKPLTPVTKDTLADYGNDKLTFYQIREGEYYLAF